MDKKKIKRKEKIRLLISAGFTFLINGYLKGFAKGEIFTGKTKYLCVPGMNCYSCPGALMSCPIGSLQAILSGREFRVSLYVLGIIMGFGTIFGRLICGFLCPFGLIQDLLFKIPFIKKIRRLPGEKALRFLKYVMLILFVILLPMVVSDVTGLGKPWFCKYVCPVGTLEGGVFLVLFNSVLRTATGFLYTYKLIILGVILILSILLYRPFCRYLCPLGALYGLFNKVSLFRYEVQKDRCTECHLCKNVCEFEVDVMKNPNSIDCIRCGKCQAACPRDAIKTVFIKKSLTKKSRDA